MKTVRENFGTRIREIAREMGFDRVAFTGAEAAEEDGERLADWFGKGNGAGMGWLGRDPRGRASPRALLAEARSVITLAVGYHAGPVPPAPGRAFGRVALYAWGGDYHAAVEARLEKFRRELEVDFGTDVLARPTVDIQPLLERAMGRRAGLGFVGKNTNLIVPGAGSFLFLATLVVNLDLTSDSPLRPGCGDCAVCRDRCPTGALASPFTLDARRCVAYHTIENRGPIPGELRAGMGDWLFGCDDCQAPCPFNARPLESRWPELSPASGPGAWVGLAEVLRTRTAEAFRRRWAGTSLLRAKRSGLVRNACLVAVHRGALDELREELGTALRQDADPLVRGHAAWALGRAASPWARVSLEGALSGETDPGVREEILTALEGGR